MVLFLVSPDGTVSAQSDNTLIYCAEQAPETFNPQLSIDNRTFDASARLIYDRLVAMELGTTKIIPALAQAWEISDNGRVYTLQLREQVAFHQNESFQPSRFFNADDVLFSFARQWRKNHPYHNVSGEFYEYFNGMGFSRTVLAVDKLDDVTVQFTLKQADASFLATLAMMFGSMLSAEYAEQLLLAGTPELLDQRPIGTGPFQYRGFESQQRYFYKSNAQYWAGAPAIDSLILDIVPDPQTRLKKLAQASCHVLAPMNATTAIEQQIWSRLRGSRVLEKPALNLAYLAYNTNKAPFDDVRVRQALNLAVDRQAILETAYRNGAKLANHILPPAIWQQISHDYQQAQQAAAEQDQDTSEVELQEPEIISPNYDITAAKAFLEQAGYGEGFRTDLWVLPVARDYMPDPLQVAKLIRADWAVLGVEAELIELPWDDFLQRSRDGDHSTLLLGWRGDNGDADNFITPLLSCTQVGGSNRAQWCDPEFEELIRQARIVTDGGKRAALYIGALQRVQEQAPWLPLVHSLRYQAMRRAVKGFTMDVFGGSFFHQVELK